MKKFNHTFTTATGLLMAVSEYGTAVEKAKAAGEEVEPFVITIYEMLSNPHEALGAYDILTMLNGQDIRVVMPITTTSMSLVIASAVKPGKAYIAEHTAIYLIDSAYYVYATSSEAKNYLNALETLESRLHACITSAFDFTKEEIIAGQKECMPVYKDALVEKGLVCLTKENRL